MTTHPEAATMQSIQIQPAGRPVLSRTSFWRIVQGNRTLGWASGYRNALAKVEQYERMQGGAHAQAS